MTLYLFGKTSLTFSPSLPLLAGIGEKELSLRPLLSYSKQKEDLRENNPDGTLDEEGPTVFEIAGRSPPDGTRASASGRHRPVVHANIIDQAGPENARFRIVARTNVEISIRSHPDEVPGILCNFCPINVESPARAILNQTNFVPVTVGDDG